MTMKRKSVLTAVILIVMLFTLFAMVGCTQRINATETVVAKVGDKEILLSQLKEAISQFEVEQAKMGVINPNPDAKIGELSLYQSLAQVYLNNLVRSELIQIKGDELGITVSDSEIDDALKRIETEAGVNEAKIRESIRISLLEQKVIDTALSHVTVSDEEIRIYFDSNPDEFDRIRVLKIRVSYEDGAVEAYERLCKGEDFKVLAGEVSENHPSDKPGDYSDEISRAELGKEYQDAVFSLKPGEISKPIQTMWGYDIYKILEFYKPSLQDVEESIRMSLLFKRHQEANTKLFEDLETAYPIIVYDEYLTDEYLKN